MQILRFTAWQLFWGFLSITFIGASFKTISTNWKPAWNFCHLQMHQKLYIFKNIMYVKTQFFVIFTVSIAIWSFRNSKKGIKLKPPNEQPTTNYHHRQIHLTQQHPKSDKGKEKMQKIVNFDGIHKKIFQILPFSHFFCTKAHSSFCFCKI
jgi:hypothetical protein